MDGKIIIGVDLETKKLNEKLNKLQKRLEQEEPTLDLKFGDLEYAREELRKTAQELDKIKKKRDEINQKIASRQKQYSEYLAMDQSNPEVRARTGFLASDIEKLKIKQQEVNSEFNAYNQKLNIANDNLVKAEVSYTKQKNKIDEINSEIDQTKQKLQSVPTEQLRKGFESVGKSIKKVTNSIGHWALALFGIRTAYNFVRSAMSTIASQDDQLNADIQYMKNALAYAIEPIVRWIVDLAKQLMFYVQAIVKALTGKDIFANADKSLQNANKGAKKLNKELSKTLANFDEMNVLQDNSSSGGNEDTLPSFSFVGAEIELPKWMQDLLAHKEELIAGIEGIAAALIALKMGLNPIQALGIGLFAAGLAYTIQKILDFIKDPSFENFIGILEGITVAIIGVAIAFGTWPVALVAAFTLIIVEIVKHFNEIKAKFDELIQWIDKNVLGKLRELFGPLGDILYLPIKYFIELARNAFETFYGGIRKVVEGVVQIFKGDFLGGIKTIFGGLINILTAPLQAFIKAVKAVWRQIKDTITYWKENFKLKFNNIGEAMLKPINTFIDAIRNLWGNIKGSVEEVARNIGEKLNPNKLFDDVKNGLSSIGGGLKNFFGFRKGGIIYPPKLAVGGVINQPGRGVPLTSAIGGEHGAEGVIPLTDSQQMQLLGEAIGKYITINASITNTMNGRVISRELQKVQNDSDFAFNR